MYRTSVFIKQYYGGKILETVPVLTLNWYYCAPLDFGLRVPVSPGHLVFSQVPGYFVYRYIRTAIRYKSQVLYLQVPVCKHRNVYRCLQIYKRPVTRPLDLSDLKVKKYYYIFLLYKKTKTNRILHVNCRN